MRVVVLAVGSRGDVEPFVALGTRLRAAGHQVTLATHREFHELAGRYGVDVAELPGDPREMLATPAGRVLLAARTPVGLVRGLRRLMDGIADSYPYAERAAAGADVVVYSTLALVGITVADWLGVPAVAAHLQPAQPTRAFPTPTLPTTRPMPRPVNRTTWRLAETLVWREFVPALNAERRRLSLSDLPRRAPSRWPDASRPTSLFGYSASVVPVPADWPSDVHVTGYWWNDPHPGWVPDPALVSFLGAGDPPVYLGFGSMRGDEPEKVARTLVAAARRVGRRAVLSGGWAGLAVAGAVDVLSVDDVPHAWLFPQMAAVVHHGGAGTTAATLRAGVPSVVVPHMVDQFFWARRLQQLGAAPAPVPRRRLDDVLLADVLAEALQPATVQAARAVAGQLSAEDGPGSAVEVIERVVRDQN